MFPSSAILEEIFPSGGDGNEIRGRYAISAIQAVVTAWDLVSPDGEDVALRSLAS